MKKRENVQRMDELIFTGERVIPNKTPKEIFIKHINRYDFACKFVRNKKVLDIACGTGYGSDYLIKKGCAKKVYGGDISKDSIDYAKKSYKNKNLSFEVMDCEKIASRDSFFDIIISFETIEPVKDYNKFLSECKRVLKKGGILIISTPNKKVSSPFTKKPLNPFHFKEFYLTEFKILLGGFFKDLEMYGQNINNYDLYFKVKKLISLIIIKTKEISPLIINILKLFIKIKKNEKKRNGKIKNMDVLDVKSEPSYLIIVAKK